VYIEWNENISVNKSQNRGDVTFSIDSTPSSFDLQARYEDGDPRVNIYLSGMSTMSEAYGAIVNLGYVSNKRPYPRYNAIPFIIAGTDGRFICNSPNRLSPSWLQLNLPMLGQRTLRQICLPESHDTGMWTRGKGTAAVTDGVVLTQSKDVTAQLGYGVRVLDIRPVISGGQLYTGHYSDNRGANGGSMASIVDQVNAFTDTYPELVIIRLQNEWQTDATPNYRRFNQDEWNRLFSELSRLKHLFTWPAGSTDLTKLTLSQYIGNKRAAVILILHKDSRDASLGPYAEKGFYYDSAFPLFDQYANSNDPNSLMNDQFAKMQREKPNPDSKMFNIGWALTQQTADVITSVLDPSKTIRAFASYMNTRLAPELVRKCTKASFPNVLGIDYIQDTIPVAVATAIHCLTDSPQYHTNLQSKL